MLTLGKTDDVGVAGRVGDARNVQGERSVMMIPLCDVRQQYCRLKEEIDEAMMSVAAVVAMPSAWPAGPTRCTLQNLGYAAGSFPNAEHAARHCLSLPMFPELTVRQQGGQAA